MQPDSLKLPDGVTLSPTAMILPDHLDRKQWRELGIKLQAFENGVQWWLGDWWHYGVHKYGERKATVTAKGAFPYTFETLMNFGYVAGAVKTSLRNEALSWSHHYAVAPLDEKKQQRYLYIAVKRKLSVAQLRANIEGAQQEEEERNQSEEEQQHDAAQRYIWSLWRLRDTTNSAFGLGVDWDLLQSRHLSVGDKEDLADFFEETIELYGKIAKFLRAGLKAEKTTRRTKKKVLEHA